MSTKLTKSQRVSFIQDIASRLAGDEWSMIDLVLKQFSFPHSDQWSGDKSNYIIAMTEDAADKDLIELAEHFGIQTGKSPDVGIIASETSYWEEGKLKVFISHLSTNREAAAALQKAFAPLGMSSFVAHNDIHPTTEWQIEIENALATCELLVAMITPDFDKSHWCDQEVGYALGRGIPVFTLRCGADPYGFVSRFQAFNGNGKQSNQIAQELFDRT